MRNLLLISVLSLFVMLSGCNKEASTAPGNSANWVGTYNGNTLSGSGLTQIQIGSTGPNSLSIILKIENDWYLYTATTLQTVQVNGTNTAVISEDQHIIEATDLGLFSFKGTVTLSGNTVTLNAVATNVSGNTENSPMNFSFTGTKAQ